MSNLKIKKMKKFNLKTLVLSTLVLCSVSLMAQGYGRGNCDGNGPRSKGFQQGMQRGERMEEFLELSDDQKTKIETLRVAHQKEMLPLKNELGEKQAKMQTLASAENADMKSINALIDEMSVIKTKMAKMRAAHKQDVRKLLSPEQRVKFDSKSRQGRGKNHRQVGRY